MCSRCEDHKRTRAVLEQRIRNLEAALQQANLTARNLRRYVAENRRTALASWDARVPEGER